MKILYFAKLRQLIGRSEDSIKLDNEVMISQVIKKLKNKNNTYLNAFNQTKNLKYAVNCEYVKKSFIVRNEDELAIFPPVNGG